MIQFEKRLVDINQAFIQSSAILKGKKGGKKPNSLILSSVNPKRIMKLQNFGIL